jgi:polar amino acid transport system permease protein
MPEGSSPSFVPSPPPRRMNRVLMLLLSLLGLWAILQLLLGGADGPDFAGLLEAAPKLLRGLGLTLYISFASVLIGSAIALILLVGLMLPWPAFKKGLEIWCILFRGTPMIAQLYLVYYGAGEIHRQLDSIHLWWFFREPLNCVMFTFVLNTSAYQARIIHGAVVNLPRELSDAAAALALPRAVTLFRILLPQALLTALRPLGNEVTKMIKASAVASLVTVLDLLGTARTLFMESFDFDFYILTALIYVLLIGGLRLVLDATEKQLSRHLAPAA